MIRRLRTSRGQLIQWMRSCFQVRRLDLQWNFGPSPHGCFHPFLSSRQYRSVFIYPMGCNSIHVSCHPATHLITYFVQQGERKDLMNEGKGVMKSYYRKRGIDKTMSYPFSGLQIRWKRKRSCRIRSLILSMKRLTASRRSFRSPPKNKQLTSKINLGTRDKLMVLQIRKVVTRDQQIDGRTSEVISSFWQSHSGTTLAQRIELPRFFHF